MHGHRAPCIDDSKDLPREATMDGKACNLIWIESLNPVVPASAPARRSARASHGAGCRPPKLARLALAVLLALGGMPLAVAGQGACPGGSASGIGSSSCGGKNSQATATGRGHYTA